jgi:hypothetical protein
MRWGGLKIVPRKIEAAIVAMMTVFRRAICM